MERRREEKNNEYTGQHRHQTDYILVSFLPGAPNDLSSNSMHTGGAPPCYSLTAILQVNTCNFTDSQLRFYWPEINR